MRDKLGYSAGVGGASELGGTAGISALGGAVGLSWERISCCGASIGRSAEGGASGFLVGASLASVGLENGFFMSGLQLRCLRRDI